MKHIVMSLLAGSGLLLTTITASAQFLPRRDSQQDQGYSYQSQRGAASPVAAIEGTLAADGVSLNMRQSADKWNYYAAETFPGFTAPAPETLFPWLANTPSSHNPYTNASHDPVSFNTWLNAIEPYLPGSGY
jgi:hypothetical protein